MLDCVDCRNSTILFSIQVIGAVADISVTDGKSWKNLLRQGSKLSLIQFFCLSSQRLIYDFLDFVLSGYSEMLS